MKNTLLAATGAFLVVIATGNNAVAQDNYTKPNVVIIFTDDQGYADLGCFGGDHVKTPNIDKLATEGMKLTRFYAAPSCTPARASLLTGSYPQRVGLPNVLFPNRPTGLNPEETTVAETLKSIGYSTACIGKWHLGDKPEFMPNNHGFDYFFGLPYSNDMYPENGKYRFPPLPLMRNRKVMETGPDQRLLTKRYTEEAVSFINKNKDRPFFLYLAHTMPHRPLFASEEFTKDVPKEKLVNTYPNSTKTMDFLYPNVISELDWSVGEVLNSLKEAGLDKDTLVIFTSDNGPSSTGLGKTTPLKGRKGSTSEGGIRVPCIATYPGVIPEGTSFDGITSTMDLLPTLAAFTGAALPEKPIDGKDISAVLKGELEISPQKYFFYYRGKGLTGVSDERFKLFKKKGSLALFDLKNDIGEKQNVIKDHPEKAKELEAAMVEMAKRLGNGKNKGSEQRPAGFAQ